MIWNERPKSKVSARYSGPWRVKDCLSNYVYVIQHLLTQTLKTVHVEKMLLYSGKEFPNLKDLKEHLLFHKKDVYEVDEILDVTQSDDQKYVLVKWLGFENDEATWEPFDIIYQDVPSLVDKFLSTKEVV